MAAADFDVQLQLGDVIFTDFEIPNELPLGGSQALKTHKLIGGTRVIDALGPDDDDIQWSGQFRGPLAFNRASYLDAQRRAGRQLPLLCDGLNYTVVIQSFQWSYQRAWEIPYRICCAVVSDNRNPTTTLLEPQLDQMVSGDLLSTLGLSGLLPLGSISSAIQGVQGAVATVQSTVALAGPLAGNVAGLNKVLNAVNSAQLATSGARLLADGQLAGIPLLAGQIAGATGSTNAGALTSTLTAMTQSAGLHQIGSYLGRMNLNLSGGLFS